jgi:diadenosine tetraphosphate (Ap4A) HIT family hydrolase
VGFHNNLKKWEQFSRIEGCPVCQNWPHPEGEVLIKEFPNSWLIATEKTSCLWGQCCIVAKTHAVELYDLNESELLNYMKEVQVVAKALKEITNAIKINYEIHGNTIPHLHMHLFPRYVKEPFKAGGAIDYSMVEPSVYKDNEFKDFVEHMKQILDKVY